MKSFWDSPDRSRLAAEDGQNEGGRAEEDLGGHGGSVREPSTRGAIEKLDRQPTQKVVGLGLKCLEELTREEVYGHAGGGSSGAT
jgi:hypothetical protein